MTSSTNRFINRPATYDKFPTVKVDAQGQAFAGMTQVSAKLSALLASHRVLVIDTYPGTLDEELLALVSTSGATVFRTADAFKDASEIEKMVMSDVTDDPVLGRMTRLKLADFLDASRGAALREAIKREQGPVVVYGVGASLFADEGAIVFADLARWEIQRRQRLKQVGNLGVANHTDDTWRKYKWAFFVDWRVADDHKRAVWNSIEWFLDTNTPGEPKLVQARDVRGGLASCVTRPFRVVPFFDPGVWGGQWMKEVCDLDRSAKNYAWCFDCVPEENSLLLEIAGVRVELPSINLVHQHPKELLGESVFGRFGPEFPIRFDFLDTMDGQHLSLQVHPLTEYIQKNFGMNYTQDESYYMLEAASDACVYLGFKEGVKPDEFVAALNDAQQDATKPLDAEKFVNAWPAKKHDHFLIPAGTIHCSGKNSMVLEISATPYIFTHKLWDWGRLDLNGKPRPISIGHGKVNLDYSRDTNWTRDSLINAIEPVAQGDGWREERTGLHKAEFIETRRHWFSKPVEHDTHGTVNVLNLVEGDQVTVESPTEAFEPYVVHYAETFIVPAAVGRYTIRPTGPSQGKACATMKAFVRHQA
jgi:mannose-6-phosphate isomerase class I